ncbi:MAG: hypothetical protein AB7O32_11780 [Vicinamibacterales bacterium]
MRTRCSHVVVLVFALAAALVTSACSSKPGDDTLRDSFAQQLGSNRFLKDFTRNGDEMTFTAEGVETEEAQWRVHIDSTSIDENNSETQPYKGTVKSSWFANGQQVLPRGGSSNLPIGLQSNGLSQDCWAFWEAEKKAWSWE